MFLCTGLALRFELSYILACLAMGATVSNLASHHERPFHAIESVEQPFLIIFFLLAGFGFQVEKLWSIGLLGLLYVAARSGGMLVGSYLGSRVAQARESVRYHTGFCLLPQAGVALGLALMVSERYPELGSQILSVIVGTTIVFEMIGPIIARFALRHAGETPSRPPGESDREDQLQK